MVNTEHCDPTQQWPPPQVSSANSRVPDMFDIFDRDSVSDSSDEEMFSDGTSGRDVEAELDVTMADDSFINEFDDSANDGVLMPADCNIVVRFGSQETKFLKTGSKINVESWILKLPYLGHFNRLVWLKNSWCTQIDVGKYNFMVGDVDEVVKGDLPIDYFVSKGRYSATGDLLNALPVELQVHNADTDELDPLQLLSDVNVTHFVLDVELDFFSTYNPFLKVYEKASCYAELIEIFRYDSNPMDYVATIERRKQQLEALRTIFEHLKTERDFTNLAPPDPSHVSDETLTRIHNLAKALTQHYTEKEIDWHFIFEIGCNINNGEVTHHISTPEQLQEYFGIFERFLQRLPIQPECINVGFKMIGGGCPDEQVNYIKSQVDRICYKNFGDPQIHTTP